MKKILFLTAMLAFGLAGFSQTTITWEGTSGGSWQDHLNWNPQQIPTLFDNVVIPSGTPHQPALFDDATAYDITIASGATLTINSNRTLYYIGDITVNGTFTVNGTVEMAVVTSANGETWMDRNLGATRVAQSSNDAAAYGDIYQWGRATEGHESRTSGVSSIKATTPVPNAGNTWDGLFIGIGSSDWLTPQDNNLWQGASGTNNPCPTGFRLPTNEEWDAERSSWATDNAAGAFGSPLNLTIGGFRNRDGGGLLNPSQGYYWSSTIGTTNTTWVKVLNFDSSSSRLYEADRAHGFNVRCIKE